MNHPRHQPVATRAVHAELILQGATIVTQDPQRPCVEALAVAHGRILHVGTIAQAHQRRSTKTEVVELSPQQCILPGLTDAHIHLAWLAESLRVPDLQACRSPEDAIRTMKVLAQTLPSGQWLCATGWDQNEWPERQMPEHWALSAAFPEHPMALRRIDGHALWVNAAAMAAAGIDRHTCDPAGGRILRQPSGGEPTGILLDTAMQLVERQIPPPSQTDRQRSLLLAIRHLQRLGLTGIHDMSMDRPTLEFLRSQADGQNLGLRVSSYLDVTADDFPPLFAQKPDDPDALAAIRGIKLFADGALGSHGAALLAPYADEPNNRGILRLETAALQGWIEAAWRRGLQVATHAIGCRANRMVLDVYERMLTRTPVEFRPKCSLRLEHAQVLHPDDVARPGRLGLPVSIQPLHAVQDRAWTLQRLGSQRLQGAYAWRTLARSGARLALGSDAPVASANPLFGMVAAVTRRPPQSPTEDAAAPQDEVLTWQEALAGYTLGAAAAARLDGLLGLVAPGYLADLTVLSGDPTRFAPQDWPSLRADMTVVAGRIVKQDEGPR